MQIHILENVLPQSGMLKIEFQMRSKNSLFPRHPTSSISTVSLGCDAAVSLVSLLSLLLPLLLSLLLPLLLPGLRVKARTRTRPQEASTPSTATSVAQDEGGELGASTARSPGPGAAVLPAAVVVVVVVVVAEDVCAAGVASVCVVFSSSGSLSKMTKDFPLSKFSCVGGQFILPNSKHSI